MFGSYHNFRPYVSVAQRKKQAAAEAAKSKKAGKVWDPVSFEGKIIARSFWGKAWCAHLESHSDYENRLPRGRSYVRSGSVVHLSIQPGHVEALVRGSSLYKLSIKIKPLSPEKWQTLCRQCAGEIGSLVDLLQGKLSDRVMAVMTHREKGLFPNPDEIDLGCSCPDWANMCKHIAAVLYGVGARLDTRPELLFTLRSVDHTELLANFATADVFKNSKTSSDKNELSDSDVSAIFGIELDTAAPTISPTSEVLPPLALASSEKLVAKEPKAAKRKATKPKLRRGPVKNPRLKSVPVTGKNRETPKGKQQARQPLRKKA